MGNVGVRVNTVPGARREHWLILAIFVLTSVVAGVGGSACSSDGAVLSDNSSITTATEPSSYIQVEVRPAEIRGETGQQVYVECTALPLVDTPVTIVSVELALFDSGGVLLRRQAFGVASRDGRWVRCTTYRTKGDETFCRLLIGYYFGTLGHPTREFSEYTAASVPVTITK